MDRTRSGISVVAVITFVRLVSIIITSLTSHPETPVIDPSVYAPGPTATFDLSQYQPQTIPMIGPDGEVIVTLP